MTIDMDTIRELRSKKQFWEATELLRVYHKNLKKDKEILQKEIDKIIIQNKKVNNECSLFYCGEKKFKSGLCETHYELHKKAMKKYRGKNENKNKRATEHREKGK